MYLVLSHKVCGDLSQQLQEVHTDILGILGDGDASHHSLFHSAVLLHNALTALGILPHKEAEL